MIKYFFQFKLKFIPKFKLESILKHKSLLPIITSRISFPIRDLLSSLQAHPKGKQKHQSRPTNQFHSNIFLCHVTKRVKKFHLLAKSFTTLNFMLTTCAVLQETMSKCEQSMVLCIHPVLKLL